MSEKPKFITKRTVIILIILSILFIGALIYDNIQYNKRIKMPASHIFICDNAKEFSEFDNWLMKDIGVDKVPMYVIIYNNNIIGIIDGNIPEEDFSSRFGTVLAEGKNLYELPDYTINNILGSTYTLKEIASQNLVTILEISWVTCTDCIEQDKYFTNDIYYKYSTDQIYRYYIKSELSDVIAKHS